MNIIKSSVSKPISNENSLDEQFNHVLEQLQVIDQQSVKLIDDERKQPIVAPMALSPWWKALSPANVNDDETRSIIVKLFWVQLQKRSKSVTHYTKFNLIFIGNSFLSSRLVPLS